MKSLFPNRKKRNKEEIIASILYAAKSGATKTRIMYVSFLSFSQLQRYISYTMDTRLLGTEANSNRYFTTNKGVEFLRRFEEVHSIVNHVIEKRKSLAEILDKDEMASYP